MAQAFHRTRLGKAALLALSATLLAGPGCLAVRETREMRIDGVVLDAASGRPVPGATVLVLAREADGTKREHRRIDAGPDGRIVADARHGWGLHPGLAVTINEPAWMNEYYFMAPGYGWIFVPLGEKLGGRPPDRVKLTPLPPEVPRLVLDDEGKRVWEAEEAFELRVPSCEGVAQGLPEGGGLLIYRDKRTVVFAAGAQESEGGLWLEGGPRGEPLRAYEGRRLHTGNRAFLDPASCSLRVEKGEP